MAQHIYDENGRYKGKILSDKEKKEKMGNDLKNGCFSVVFIIVITILSFLMFLLFS